MDKNSILHQLEAANKQLIFLKLQNKNLTTKLAEANNKARLQSEEKTDYRKHIPIAEKKDEIAAERNISLNELAKGELEFGPIIGNVKDYAIFMLDLQGCVATWNSGAKRIKGYSEEEIVGKSMNVFYTQVEMEDGEPQRNLQKALTHGHFETEGFRVRKDGSIFYANIVITPMLNKQGKHYGYLK